MSIDGRWKFVVDTPMGRQEATADFATANGLLVGTAVSAFGSVPLEEGTVSGDRATWTVRLTAPFPIVLQYEAVFTGDTVSGHADTGMFGKVPFHGARIA